MQHKNKNFIAQTNLKQFWRMKYMFACILKIKFYEVFVALNLIGGVDDATMTKHWFHWSTRDWYAQNLLY